MTDLEAFLAQGVAVAVDPDAIEHELRRFWKESSEEENPVTRACRFNLVVCCESPEDAAHATAVVARVTADRPSRVMMCAVDPGIDGDRLQAAITAHCTLPEPGRRREQVCCEQISIVAGVRGVARVPGAVRSLLLSDLPVLLWNTADLDPTGSAADLMARLIGDTDRVLVDSCRFKEPAARFRNLVELSHPLTDLTWLRLRAWRELLAGMFDDPACLERLDGIDRIRITHAPGPASPTAESLLLGAWVATRLGWRLTRPAGPAAWALTRRDGGACHIELDARAGEARPGIVSLSLEAPGASFRLARAGEVLERSVTLEGAGTVSHRARAVARDKATLIGRALEAASTDTTFDASLHLAAELTA